MPGLDRELGILAISHGLPAGLEHLVENGLVHQLIDGHRLNAIDTRAQRLLRNKMIGRMRRSYIHLHDLCSQRHGKQATTKKQQQRYAFQLRHDISSSAAGTSLRLMSAFKLFCSCASGSREFRAHRKGIRIPAADDD